MLVIPLKTLDFVVKVVIIESPVLHQMIGKIFRRQEMFVDDLKKQIDYYESLDKQELIDNLTIVKSQLLNCEKELDRLSLLSI